MFACASYNSTIIQNSVSVFQWTGRQLLIIEGFIQDDTAAYDANHFEARNQAPYKRDKDQAAPKKRDRNKKDEREQWLIEQAEQEANRPLYEK